MVPRCTHMYPYKKKASISDDPGVAWDLLASGFLILTGQWAAVAEGKGLKKPLRKSLQGGLQREAG